MMPSLDGKKWLPLVKKTTGCRLNFSDRMVYSYLTYQERYGAGSSVTSIARFTGLARDVVPDRLKQLREFGLAIEEGGEHFAAVPSGETAAWFPVRKGGGLAYYPVYLAAASCPLTDRQNALYWCLRDLARGGTEAKGQTESGLAALLSVSRQTVRAAIAALRGHGLVQVGRGRRMLAFRILEFPTSWIRDARETPVPTEEEYVWDSEDDDEVGDLPTKAKCDAGKTDANDLVPSDDDRHLTFDDLRSDLVNPFVDGAYRPPAAGVTNEQFLTMLKAM
jgi:biotin operon repressor